MKLGTSLAIGAVVTVGSLFGIAALASSREPPPLPPAPPAQRTAVFEQLKGLMSLIRGNVPPNQFLAARTDQIIDYISRRNAAKIYPAVTKGDLETLYEIARSRT